MCVCVCAGFVLAGKKKRNRPDGASGSAGWWWDMGGGGVTSGTTVGLIHMAVGVGGTHKKGGGGVGVVAYKNTQ